jgi:hypothetical protein
MDYPVITKLTAEQLQFFADVDQKVEQVLSAEFSNAHQHYSNFFYLTETIDSVFGEGFLEAAQMVDYMKVQTEADNLTHTVLVLLDYARTMGEASSVGRFMKYWTFYQDFRDFHFEDVEAAAQVA